MIRVTALLMAAAALVPAAASAQEFDVTRRTYTFLDNRLDVVVLAQVPGVLHVVRGDLGRVEVAARTVDGFASFGVGGSTTRQLRLTAVGAESVQYLVVVPERVSVRVRLPEGQSFSLASRQPSASYAWGLDTQAAAAPAAPAAPPATPGAAADPLLPTSAGLYVAHRETWAPDVLNIPDLRSVRSISLRFEGGEFRIAASRPLVVQPGDRSQVEVRVEGEPLDLVVHIPRGRAAFTLRSGTRRIASFTGNRPEAHCRNVVIQTPTPEQSWLTFYPQAGLLDCR